MSHQSRIAFIHEQDVVLLHEMVIGRFESLSGIRDISLLQSAVNQSIMMVQFGNDEDRAIHGLAATYFFHIIKNHPFIDGNKRTSVLTAVEFLLRNGFKLTIADEELYQLALDVASSKIGRNEVAQCLQRSIKPIQKKLQ